jgi:hypothetical protein
MVNAITMITNAMITQDTQEDIIIKAQPLLLPPPQPLQVVMVPPQPQP